MPSLSNREKEKIITLYEQKKSCRTIHREIGGFCAISTVHRVVRRYISQKNVEDKRRGRAMPRKARTEENIKKVKDKISKSTVNSPPFGQRRIANRLNTRTSVQRIIKNDLKFKCFKACHKQVLTDQNKLVRLQRGKRLLRTIKASDVKDILFTDETVFPFSFFLFKIILFQFT